MPAAHPCEDWFLMPCTTFSIPSAAGPVVGTNYDFTIPYGLAFACKRGLAKSGTETNASGRTAEWTSRFGSLTFNLVGYQIVQAGINEAGLVVTTMRLPGSRPPPPDERPSLYSGLWLQFLLDTCETVEEALRSLDSVANIRTQEHYLIADANGDCGIVEFLDGTVAMRNGDRLPTRVLTNSPYEVSIGLRADDSPDPFAALRHLYPSSQDRFDEAASRVRNASGDPPRDPVAWAFETLDAVSGVITQRSLVFESEARRVAFRTRANPEIRTLSLVDFDFSPAQPAEMMDVDAGDAGDVRNEFGAYCPQTNRRHQKRALEGLGASMPDASLDAWIRHFEGFEPADEARLSPER